MLFIGAGGGEVMWQVSAVGGPIGEEDVTGRDEGLFVGRRRSRSGCDVVDIGEASVGSDVAVDEEVKSGGP